MIVYILSMVISVAGLLVAQIATQTDTITMIDQSFYWGLICITVGACFYILQTGFLQLFFDGFRKFSTAIVPKSRSLERANQQLKEDASLNMWKQSVFLKGKNLFLGIGSGMTLFSFAIILFI